MWMMPLHLHVNQKSDYDMMIYDFWCEMSRCCQKYATLLRASFQETALSRDSFFGINLIRVCIVSQKVKTSVQNFTAMTRPPDKGV